MRRVFKPIEPWSLLSRDKAPSLGHMVSYYASVEVWTGMLGLPGAIKHGGDTDEMWLLKWVHH